MEENSIQLHNLFFYANACHVCKAFGKKTKVKRCGSCSMISYCSKEHQKEHWPEHRDLCKIIKELRDDPKTSSFFETDKQFDLEDWTRMKTNLMLLAQLKLSRRLMPYEEQMFKFPRMCIVCRRRNGQSLTDCPDCPCASFCPMHLKDSNHSDQCPLLKLCFILDVYCTVFEREVPRTAIPYHTEAAFLPKTIKDFIELYVNVNEFSPMSTECQSVSASEFLTRPLTLLYAMEVLGLEVKKDFEVHVVGANDMELVGLELWESLLHWLPALRTLRIVFVGPELQSLEMLPNVCDWCLNKDLKVVVQIIGTTYERFREEHEAKADIVIGYNVGFHEYDLNSPKDTWAKSIPILAKQDCPFVMTSYTLDEALEDHKRLCRVLGNNDLDYFECRLNPYGSLRPHRNFESEGLYYQNQCIAMYKRLQTEGN